MHAWRGRSARIGVSLGWERDLKRQFEEVAEGLLPWEQSDGRPVSNFLLEQAFQYLRFIWEKMSLTHGYSMIGANLNSSSGIADALLRSSSKMRIDFVGGLKLSARNSLPGSDSQFWSDPIYGSDSPYGSDSLIGSDSPFGPDSPFDTDFPFGIDSGFDSVEAWTQLPRAAFEVGGSRPRSAHVPACALNRLEVLGMNPTSTYYLVALGVHLYYLHQSMTLHDSCLRCCSSCRYHHWRLKCDNGSDRRVR